MALMSAPEKKMTLNGIYRWISTNIPHFRNKEEDLSSSTWKVGFVTVLGKFAPTITYPLQRNFGEYSSLTCLSRQFK